MVARSVFALTLFLVGCAAAAHVPAEPRAAEAPSPVWNEAARHAAICANPQDFYENRAYCFGEEP